MHTQNIYICIHIKEHTTAKELFLIAHIFTLDKTNIQRCNQHIICLYAPHFMSNYTIFCFNSLSYSFANISFLIILSTSVILHF